MRRTRMRRAISDLLTAVPCSLRISGVCNASVTSHAVGTRRIPRTTEIRRKRDDYQSAHIFLADGDVRLGKSNVD